MEIIVVKHSIWAVYVKGIKVDKPENYDFGRFEYVEGEFLLKKYLVVDNLIIVEPVTLVFSKQDVPRKCCDGSYLDVETTFDIDGPLPTDEDDPDFHFFSNEATQNFFYILSRYPELTRIKVKLAIEGTPYITDSLKDLVIEEILFKGESEHSLNVFELGCTKVSLFPGFTWLISENISEKFTDVTWNSEKDFPIKFKHTLDSYSTPNVYYRNKTIESITIPKTKKFVSSSLWNETILCFIEFGVEEFHVDYFIGDPKELGLLPFHIKIYVDSELIVGKDQTKLTELL